MTVGILSSDCKQQSLCVSRVHLGTSRWFPLLVHEAFCFYVSLFTCVVLFCVLPHYSVFAVASFLMSSGCILPLHLPLSCSCFLQVFDGHDGTSSHFYGDGQVGSLYLHCCLHIHEVHMYIRSIRFAFILYAHHSV